MKRMLVGALAAVLMVLGGTAGALAAPPPSHWCGTDETAQDRLPDAVASYQVHAAYVLPSDGTDRFFERALPIAQDLALIDTWWRGQDPTRTPRFDLNAFPGCDTTFGALDISVVRLPRPSSAYFELQQGGYQALVLDLIGALTDPYKKYLVYYEGPIDPNLGICGSSSFGPIDSGRSFAIAFLDSHPACGSLGAGNYMAATAVHELVHNLGAVSSSAPHACMNGHVCDAQNDLMASFGTSDSLFDYVLDVGRDDYYGHSGSWWDVQDSAWLSHLDGPQFSLTVSSSGAGSGSIKSDLPGIACPPACSIQWDSGTKVTLSAQATVDDGSQFAGWQGACSGIAECVVTMDGAKTVTAAFNLPTPVSVTIESRGGQGRVTSNPAGIACPGTCQASFDQGTRITLTATPDRRSRLISWSVAACAARLTCAVAAQAGTAVRAAFGPGFLRLTAAVRGAGRVMSTPAGISCTRTCSASFPYGRSVRLAAKPAKGWRFAGWSGDCRGLRACVVKLDKGGLVRASFRRTQS